MQTSSGTAEQSAGHFQYSDAEQLPDNYAEHQSTMEIPTIFQTSSGAETPTGSSDNTATEQPFESPWLLQTIDFCGWYTSAHCAIASKTWKQAVDEVRRQVNDFSDSNCSIINDAVLNVVEKSYPELDTLCLRTCGVNEMGMARHRSVNFTAAASEAVAKGGVSSTATFKP